MSCTTQTRLSDSISLFSIHFNFRVNFIIIVFHSISLFSINVRSNSMFAESQREHTEHKKIELRGLARDEFGFYVFFSLSLFTQIPKLYARFRIETIRSTVAAIDCCFNTNKSSDKRSKMRTYIPLDKLFRQNRISEGTKGT